MREQNKNPYTAYGNSGTRTSIVVSLDILGFQAFIRSKYPRKTLNRKLRLLRNCVAKSYEYVRDHAIPNQIDCQRFWETRAYSDNITICYPISTDNLDVPGYPRCSDNTILALSHALFMLRNFQLEMICSGGFFIRGAIAIGEAFADENIIFGDALLEAHDSEQNLAIYPRIILSESARKYVIGYLKANRNGDSYDFLTDLLLDSDGEYFVNYLNSVLPDEGLFLKANRRIHKRLRFHKNDSKLLRKYLWCAAYHNNYYHQNCIYNDNNKNMFISTSSGLSVNCGVKK